MALHPAPKSHFPPPPEAPHAHLQMEQRHQRSHQGIPQWTMDETHDPWLPPTNYQWIYSHQPPMDPIKTSSHTLNPALQPSWFPSTPWFLSHPINPGPCSWTFMVPINPMVPIRISLHHLINSALQPPWFLSIPMVPINPNGSYQIPSALFFNPNGSSQAWTPSFLSTPSQSPQTLFLEAATCSLPSWWTITSCSF